MEMHAFVCEWEAYIYGLKNHLGEFVGGNYILGKFVGFNYILGKFDEINYIL